MMSSYPASFTWMKSTTPSSSPTNNFREARSKYRHSASCGYPFYHTLKNFEV
jgi:hypothetical protein